MKNSSNSRAALRLFGTLSLVAAALCIAFRVVGIMMFFDSDIGYFQNDSIVATIAQILPIVFVAVALVVCVLPIFKNVPCCTTHSKPINVCAILCAGGFGGYAVSYGITLFDYISLGFTIPTSYWLILASSVFAAVFFILIAFREQNGNAIYVISGIFAVLWMILSLAASYFDVYLQMNSPLKMGFQFATLAAALLIINELRVDLDVKHTRLHLFSASVATIFLGSVSIASVVGTVMEKMPMYYDLYTSDCVLLPLFLFSVVRLCVMCFTPIEEPDVDVLDQTAITEDEEAREPEPQAELTGEDEPEAEKQPSTDIPTQDVNGEEQQ